MQKNMTFHKKKVWVVFLCCMFFMFFLIGRIIYIMGFRSDYYYEKAEDLHERERNIKALRGKLLDRNGEILADNKTVCTISVIHNQIKDKNQIISVLSKELSLSEEYIKKRVEKISSIERIKSNVDKETGDKIRGYELSGVKVDEDYKRYYPYNELASKVLGFTGGDNQGVTGLEVKYDHVLQGIPGKILTTTDARGIELDGVGERRKEPIAGKDIQLSIDVNIQKYAQQAALKVMEEKQADRVSILLMNPQNGEIYACVNVPEFDLNNPFELGEDVKEKSVSVDKEQDLLNQMWRNACLNDTYEPGSTFKIITMAAGLEEGIVSLEDTFYCPGYKLVEDRRIHCARRTGHGSQNFVQGAQNSCNPVFIEVGLRLGVEKYYNYFSKFNLLKKTGIDVPGEAGTIMHKMENMGEVELATVAFGQSFQITPVRLAATVSSIINGGKEIVPHFAVNIQSQEGREIEKIQYPVNYNVLSEETSKKVRFILEKVVSEGSGKNAFIEEYQVGGKTATSQTLPRSANKYISSFLGFAPADDPEILGICIIHDPKGVYYGGTIAAPVIKNIFENVLPYMGIAKKAK